MTVRRFLALGVVAWGCAAPPVFTPIVVFESETLAARADRVEVFVTSAPCPDRAAAAAVPPAQPNGFVLGPRVLRRGEVGAAFGDVPYDATAYL